MKMEIKWGEGRLDVIFDIFLYCQSIKKIHEKYNEIMEWLISRLREKAALYLSPDDGNITAETLSRFGDAELTVADARAAGCCLPGITQFRERHSLPMTVRLADLAIDKERLNEMLKNEDFRRTLSKRIESLTGDGNG